jgi:hypothetical protein
MTALPMPFRWTGEAMEPVGRFAKTADREFCIGQIYTMVEEDASTSDLSRRHFFACLRDAWMSLPDDLGQQFPTSESFRKHALILTGFANSTQFVCPTKGEAIRTAAALRTVQDEYAIINIDGCVVTRLTAKSMSRRAMKAKDFQAAKNSVFEYIAPMIGVSADELAKQEQAV